MSGFWLYVKNKKNKVTNIKQLQSIIGISIENELKNEFNKMIRMMGYFFLKRKAISYIYHSKIK